MTKLQQLLAVLVSLAALAGAAAKYTGDHAAAAVENDRLHREVHQLKAILVSEFPSYTAAMEWDSH